MSVLREDLSFNKIIAFNAFWPQGPFQMYIIITLCKQPFSSLLTSSSTFSPLLYHEHKVSALSPECHGTSPPLLTSRQGGGGGGRDLKRHLYKREYAILMCQSTRV